MKKIDLLLSLILVVFAPLFSFSDTANHGKTSARNYLVYVGTYTNEQSKGIYAYRLNAATGRFVPLGLAVETSNPSFLAVHPNHKIVYAVNETGNFQNQSSGAVSAFAIDSRTGKLTLLNQVASRGADPRPDEALARFDAAACLDALGATIPAFRSGAHAGELHLLLNNR